MSKSCLREVRATLAQGKRVTLMADPERGGAPLEVIKNDECPDEMRGAVFDDRGVVLWHRLQDFQFVSLKQLAEQLLLSCPAYLHEAALPLFIPGELTMTRWGFAPPVHAYCSPNNPGALGAMRSVLSELASELARTKKSVKSLLKGGDEDGATAAVGLRLVEEAPTTQLSEGSWRRKSSGAPAAGFILYLSKETWRGDAGDALAEEVRAARGDGLPITMVHSTPDNEDDGCDFSLFFATVRLCPRTRAICEPSAAHVHAPAPLQTPADLIQEGLYTALALALHPPPFRHVSACLVARALGASRVSASGGAGARSGSFRSTSAAALLQRVATGRRLAGKATPVAEAKPVPADARGLAL